MLCYISGAAHAYLEMGNNKYLSILGSIFRCLSGTRYTLLDSSFSDKFDLHLTFPHLPSFLHISVLFTPEGFHSWLFLIEKKNYTFSYACSASDLLQTIFVFCSVHCKGPFTWVCFLNKHLLECGKCTFVISANLFHLPVKIVKEFSMACLTVKKKPFGKWFVVFFRQKYGINEDGRYSLGHRLQHSLQIVGILTTTAESINFHAIARIIWKQIFVYKY